MAVYNCPVCRQRHVVQRYDAKDAICPNDSSGPNQRTFRDLPKTDQLTTNAYNQTPYTRKDYAIPATVYPRPLGYDKIVQLDKSIQRRRDEMPRPARG